MKVCPVCDHAVCDHTLDDALACLDFLGDDDTEARRIDQLRLLVFDDLVVHAMPPVEVVDGPTLRRVL